jgi:ABC-type branched-subunit amino acid transport system ATPase component
VIVEHYFNIPEVLKIATTVWTLSNGKISRQMPNQVKFKGSAIPGYALHEWMQEIANNDAEIETFERHGARVSAIAPPPTKGQPGILEVKDVVVYRHKRLVVGMPDESGEIRGISFYLKKGQLVIFEAPNGWGKTTLLEALAGLVPVGQGSIAFHEHPIELEPTWLRAKRGLRLLQSRNNFFPNLSVRESLVLSGVQPVPEELATLVRKKMSYLSGGELQRVVTSCALDSGGSSVLLLDEPFNALDPEGVKELARRIKNVLQDAAVLIAVPSVHF